MVRITIAWMTFVGVLLVFCWLRGGWQEAVAGLAVLLVSIASTCCVMRWS